MDVCGGMPPLFLRDALGLVVVGNLALSDGWLVRIQPEGNVPATRCTTEVAGTHQFFGRDDPKPRRTAPHRAATPIRIRCTFGRASILREMLSSRNTGSDT